MLIDLVIHRRDEGERFVPTVLKTFLGAVMTEASKDKEDRLSTGTIDRQLKKLFPKKFKEEGNVRSSKGEGKGVASSKDDDLSVSSKGGENRERNVSSTKDGAAYRKPEKSAASGQASAGQKRSQVDREGRTTTRDKGKAKRADQKKRTRMQSSSSSSSSASTSDSNCSGRSLDSSDTSLARKKGDSGTADGKKARSKIKSVVGAHKLEFSTTPRVAAKWPSTVTCQDTTAGAAAAAGGSSTTNPAATST